MVAPADLCPHCGETLALAKVMRTTDEGYEYVCDNCAIRTDAKPDPS